MLTKPLEMAEEWPSEDSRAIQGYWKLLWEKAVSVFVGQLLRGKDPLKFVKGGQIVDERRVRSN